MSCPLVQWGSTARTLKSHQIPRLETSKHYRSCYDHVGSQDLKGPLGWYSEGAWDLQGEESWETELPIGARLRLPTTMKIGGIPNQLRILHYKNQVNHF